MFYVLIKYIIFAVENTDDPVINEKPCPASSPPHQLTNCF